MCLPGAPFPQPGLKVPAYPDGGARRRRPLPPPPMTILLILLAALSAASALFFLGAQRHHGGLRDPGEQAAEDAAQLKFIEEYQRARQERSRREGPLAEGSEAGKSGGS